MKSVKIAPKRPVRKTGYTSVLSMSENYIQTLCTNVLKEFARPSSETIKIIQKLNQGVGPMETTLNKIIKSDLVLKDFTISRYRQNMADEVWYTGSIVASNKKYLIPIFYSLKLSLLLLKRIIKITDRVVS